MVTNIECHSHKQRVTRSQIKSDAITIRSGVVTILSDIITKKSDKVTLQIDLNL